MRLQYSFSLTTFSPSGKLMQIEYALNAVQAGAISLGIKATNGVVLATEKKLPSTLIDDSTVRKINDLTTSVGCVYSGMGPDNRVLVKSARQKAEAYKRQYNEEVPVAQIVRDVAATMQEFTRALRLTLACVREVCLQLCPAAGTCLQLRGVAAAAHVPAVHRALLSRTAGVQRGSCAAVSAQGTAGVGPFGHPTAHAPMQRRPVCAPLGSHAKP